MIRDLQLRLTPECAYNSTKLKTIIAKELNILFNDITGYRIIKRSIDARQRQVMVNLSVKVFINQPVDTTPMYDKILYPDVTDSPQVIVVGAGPAGLFASLRLIELGLKPIVLERGKDVDSRRVDMANIARKGIVDSESNYCFGEGGAGAYSDGKLYTRSKKEARLTKFLLYSMPMEQVMTFLLMHILI